MAMRRGFGGGEVECGAVERGTGMITEEGLSGLGNRGTTGDGVCGGTTNTKEKPYGNLQYRSF